MDKEPIFILPNKTESEISYNHRLMMDKETLVSFLKSNGIKGWPTTNRDNPVNRHSSFLKFWEGNIIG